MLLFGLIFGLSELTVRPSWQRFGTAGRRGYGSRIAEGPTKVKQNAELGSRLPGWECRAHCELLGQQRSPVAEPQTGCWYRDERDAPPAGGVPQRKHGKLQTSATMLE